MSARVIFSICIYLDVRGCTNSMCIQLQIPSILFPLLRTYACVSPAHFTVADIRKVRRRKNFICIHFRKFHFRIHVLFTCLTKVCVWILLYGYFCYSVVMKSGILSEPSLVNILLLFMIAL